VKHDSVLAYKNETRLDPSIQYKKQSGPCTNKQKQSGLCTKNKSNRVLAEDLRQGSSGGRGGAPALAVAVLALGVAALAVEGRGVGCGALAVACLRWPWRACAGEAMAMVVDLQSSCGAVEEAGGCGGGPH
jgi:hypothetical protein